MVFFTEAQEKYALPTQLFQETLGETPPTQLGTPLGLGTRAHRPQRGFINQLRIGDTDVVLKRSLLTLQQLRRNCIFTDLPKDEKTKMIDRTTPLRHISLRNQATEAYRKEARDYAPDAPKELQLEEALGVYVGDNGEYWIMTKYYAPFDPAITPLATREEALLYERARNEGVYKLAILMKAGFHINDFSTIITKTEDGDFASVIIDTEYLHRINR